jgi:hypothetical protein
MALALEKCLASIGGEGLEEFASRELALERASHRTRLSAITEKPVAPVAPQLLPLARAPSSKSASPIAVASADILPVVSASEVPRSAPPTVEERTPQSRSTQQPALDVVEAPELPPRGGRVMLALLAAAVVAAVLAIGAQNERKLPVPVEASVELAEAQHAARELKDALDTIVPSLPAVEPSLPAVEAVAVDSPTVTPVREVLVEAQAIAPAVATATRAETASAAVALEDLPDAEPAQAGADEDEVAQTEEALEDTPAIPPPVVNAKTAKPKVLARAVERRKPAARSTFGYVTFEAEPNAVVVIDGKVAGYTPIRNLKLPVGKHELQLRRPYTRVLRMKRIVWVGENKRVKITSREKKK